MVLNECCQSGLCTVITALVFIMLGVLVVNVIRRLIKVNSISKRVDNIISLVHDTDMIFESKT